MAFGPSRRDSAAGVAAAAVAGGEGCSEPVRNHAGGAADVDGKAVPSGDRDDVRVAAQAQRGDSGERMAAFELAAAVGLLAGEDADVDVDDQAPGGRRGGDVFGSRREGVLAD